MSSESEKELESKASSVKKLTSPEPETEKVTEETSLCGTLEREGISIGVEKDPNYKGKSQDQVRLSELEDMIKVLTAQINKVATGHTQLKVENAKLTERITSYDSKNTTEHEKLASMYAEMMTNHTKTWGKLTDIQGKLSNGPVGAFSAYMDQAYTYSSNQAVIFPKIIYNTGCYNTRTGIFTAPVKAVYAFHIHIMEYSSQNTMTIRVKKGSTILGYVGTGYDSSASSYDRGSGTIITQLDEEEQLLLDAHYHAGSYFRLYGTSTYGYNYFSGYPIQPIV